MENETNLTTAIINAIEEQKGCTEAPRSAYEAYAELLHLTERAKDIESNATKLMKEIWTGVKQADETTICAYLRELESNCRNTAAAYAMIAATAGLAGDAL